LKAEDKPWPGLLGPNSARDLTFPDESSSIQTERSNSSQEN
jgi:hypothetical protein